MQARERDIESRPLPGCVPISTFAAHNWKSDLPADRAMAIKAIRNWQLHRDLKGIREPEALAQMPPDEQQEFTRFLGRCRRDFRR